MASLVTVVIVLSLIIAGSLSQTCDYYETNPLAISYRHVVVYANYSNSIYLFGGNPSFFWVQKWYLDDNTWGGVTAIPEENVYVYDIPTDSWDNTTLIAKPMYTVNEGCVTTDGEYIFVVDGVDNSNVHLQIYDIINNQWNTKNMTTVSTGTSAWTQQYCHVVKDKLFIFGGSGPNILSTNPGDGIFKYHLGTNELTRIGTLPTEQSQGGAVIYGDLIYLVGGAGDKINAFNYVTEKLSPLNTLTLKEGVMQTSGVIVDNKLYILGGYTGNSSLNRVQVCNLSVTLAPSMDPTTNPTISPANNPSIFSTSKATTKSPTNYPITTTYPGSMAQTTSTSPVAIAIVDINEGSQNTKQSMDDTIIIVCVITGIFVLLLAVAVIIYVNYKHKSTKRALNKMNASIQNDDGEVIHTDEPQRDDVKEIEKMHTYSLHQTELQQNEQAIQMNLIHKVDQNNYIVAEDDEEAEKLYEAKRKEGEQNTESKVTETATTTTGGAKMAFTSDGS